MHAGIIYSLGVLLCAALVGGWVAQMLRLPRVTAYLLVGLLLGPHTRELLPVEVSSYLPQIPEEHLDTFDPIGKLAMALVLFSIGCHFPLVRFRRILRRVLRLSAGEIGLTFALVTVGVHLAGMPWSGALLLGALAIATAPATTILVLRENESEGPVTEYATALVVFNNLAAVIAFELLLLFVHLTDGNTAISMADELSRLAQDLAGSLALGVAAGLLLSYAAALLSASRLVLLVAVSSLLLGVCHMTQIPYLLAFLAMGATVASASDRARELVEELDRITGLVCIVFFVIHGAEMDLTALKAIGGVGAAYVVLRLVGKYFGTFWAFGKRANEPGVRRWLGATLFSQAGAAIVLASMATDPANGLGEMGVTIQTIILGTVIIFEILGPIMIRTAVLRTGEVPIDQAIRHTSTTPLDELTALIDRVKTAVGLDPWKHRSMDEIKVSQLMRKNVRAIPAAANFRQVIDFIEHSHDNTFAVVANEDVLMGVIRYPELRDTLFDPEMGELVCAVDLASPARRLLFADEPLSQAREIFRRTHDDCIPVVSREEPHVLLGMVKRRDLFRLFLKGDGNGGEESGDPG